MGQTPMNMPRLLIIGGLLTVVLVLIVAVERTRNCRYTGGVHCDRVHLDISKFGGGVRVGP